MEENMLTVCRFPVLEHDNSNRICKEKSNFTCLPSTKLTFEKCVTTDEIRDMLEGLDKLGMHIMGSCGHIYHSKNLATILEGLDQVWPPLFPRTFGLRAAVIRCSVWEYE